MTVNKNELHMAPCGIPCNICLAYQRKKNICTGCNEQNEQKPNYCRVCQIKNCEEKTQTETGLCFACP